MHSISVGYYFDLSFIITWLKKFMSYGFYPKKKTSLYDFSLLPGAGASATEGALADQIVAANVAKECLLAAVKADGKSAHIWANLANAFSISGDHRSSGKCLEKVLMAPCYSHL